MPAQAGRPAAHLEYQPGKGDANGHAELGDSNAATQRPTLGSRVTQAAADQAADSRACTAKRAVDKLLHQAWQASRTAWLLSSAVHAPPSLQAPNVGVPSRKRATREEA